ncbi:MAG TPA: lipid-A-disaccharide synthase [Candidatus Latescibacteria bacterium]|nr:lipid-A-disaccharide synthase [Candidatus Latescibacterota bacterium]
MTRRSSLKGYLSIDDGADRMNGPVIMIVAGEASGDLHGSNLIKEIRRIRPEVKAFGIGGPKMREAEVKLFYEIGHLSLVGFSEVLVRLPFLWRVLSHMRDLLKEKNPDLLVLIDYPGFNLRLARSARHLGIPVMYYISPQVWAWGASRISRIRRWVSKMVVILPFEEDLFHKYGVDAEFVGHPLLDVVHTGLSKSEFCRRWDIPPGSLIVGLLPGSRSQEVKRILPIMIQSAAILNRELCKLELVVASTEMGDSDLYDRIIQGTDLRVRVARGETYEVMRHSDLLLVASGTATLEAAIIGTPMIILYKMAFLSYQIGRILVKIPNVGLANIVAGRKIVPEFIQGDARPEKIASAALELLQNGDKSRRMRRQLNQVRERLGRKGTSRRVARIALRLIDPDFHQSCC